MRIKDIVPNSFSFAVVTSIDIDDIPSFIREGKRKVNLSPSFQRGSVWDIDQKIAFVEYIASGGAVTPIILNCPTYQGYDAELGCNVPIDDFEVVDGKQRLEALLDFMDGKFPIFGYSYSDLKVDTKRPFGNISINFAIIRCSYFKELVDYYIRLNFAGTSHTHDEFEALREIIS